MRTRSFWLLFSSYVGCGFTDFVMYVQFPDFCDRHRSERADGRERVRSDRGLAIIGVIGMGAWADRVGFKIPLVLIYAVRCVGVLLLAMTGSAAMLFVAVVVYGLVHQATTP